jgi:hypothetical protein
VLCLLLCHDAACSAKTVVSSRVRWLYWVPLFAAQDSLEQQLQLEVVLSAARAAAAEAGSRQEAAHAEAAELRERVQASL